MLFYDKLKTYISEKNPSHWAFPKENSVLTEIESNQSLLFWKAED